ncbi:MAG: ATP synthase F1 subunit delta [Oscillospiraceae bacterium]
MNNTIFFRYANSLFELAKEAKSCDDIYTQLSVLCAIFENNNDIKKFFANFSISKEEKFKLVDQDFGSDFNIYIINFLKLLIDKYRIQFLPKIFSEFKVLYNNYKNIKQVTVISAIKLSVENKNKIVNVLKEKLKMAIDLIEIVNPALIGGLIIKYDDKMFDASLRGKFKNLEKKLTV